MGWLLDQVAGWLLGFILGSFLAILAVIEKSLLISPDVTTLPQVQALTGRSVWIVDTVFVLVFVAAGTLTMVAGGNERLRYGVKELLPRAVVGFVAAHFSTLLVSQAINLGKELGPISDEQSCG